VTVRSGIGDLKDESGTTHSDDISKADILNDFFCSVFTKENTDAIPELEIKHTGPKLASITITTDIVTKHVKKLNSNKSTGPDGFHPRVLKELVNEISNIQ
jgi:hypothetical protein